MAEAALGRDALRTIARDGLVLPRAPYPGQQWQPRTEAETHLVGEGRRLDGHRRRLLAELARMRTLAQGEHARAARVRAEADRLAAEAEELRRTVRTLVADRTSDPSMVERLTDEDLQVLRAAAWGEPLARTAARLGLTQDAVKGRRRAASRRAGAPTFQRALVIAAAAGVVTTSGDAS